MIDAKVMLIGGDQQENLPLQYLAAALEKAGAQVKIVAFNDVYDGPKAIAQVLAWDPLCVGIAMPYQYAVESVFALAKTLRAQGFRGHLTGGGHVPTFCYDEVFRDAPEFDSLVIHEGEDTIVELVRHLASGTDWTHIAGLACRGHGKPKSRAVETNLDRYEWPTRPVSPHVAGFPIAFLLTARGCIGECAYCSIRAFTRDAGGPAFRVRAAEQVAREVAYLRNERQTKIIFVQDDLFIVPPEDRAIARMKELHQALERHHVTDLGFWIKGRPESITLPVLQAAKELGAMHLFLGVENDSDARLKYLGRYHRSKDNRTAIALCRQAGIAPSFNIMLFDPDCTLDDVATNAAFLREHLDLAWNFCRTEIYSGTHLIERLQAEGRLEGNYRSYGYEMKDARCEVLFRIMRVSFHDRAFAFDSLLNRLVSMSFARQVHDHFLPGAESRELSDSILQMTIESRRDTVNELERAIEFVRTHAVDDREGITRFAQEQAMAMAKSTAKWKRIAQRYWETLSHRGQLNRTLSALSESQID